MAIVFAMWAAFSLAQQPHNPADVPPHFKLDLETAARLRPQLRAQSIAATGAYIRGHLVFEKLVQEAAAPSGFKLSWDLRVVDDGQFNAYASPDGTIYVESGLARLAGASSGLWAAILSHEIAHVVRRDWARRYLYQKSLQSGSGTAIVLGDPGLPSVSWSDSRTASEDLARFCRQLELEADREGLMLMARAGYHPDFVPALHHLLHAQSSGDIPASLYAMHPCWEERDRELTRVYLAAALEFERLWPEWYASPGGNPPVVVFTEAPTVRKTSSTQWVVDVPLRCQNLAGAVEVVLRSGMPETPPNAANPAHPASNSPQSGDEQRQVTGCTSPTTTVSFTLPASAGQGPQWTDIYVVDAWGSVLARADFPKLRH
ncbi:MAG TPA: M48 family metalloprotease [Verrucomicrobiae bacterium]|nr:M48 family metalloprotease [Verrucomicrobiae bacterium]